MAVRPQVEAGYTAFVVMPSWMYLTARTVALLDARAIGGRLFAVIVSVPTTAAEIRAVSGLSSVGAHHIFIEGATAPPPEDEALQVQEGALSASTDLGAAFECLPRRALVLGSAHQATGHWQQPCGPAFA